MIKRIVTIGEAVQERTNELVDAARKKFRDAVRPIYGVTNQDAPNHIGSAVLISLPEGHFLLTAAHVIDWNESTSLYLGADEPALLHAEAFITAAPGQDRRKDHWDFAVLPLDASIKSRLANASFITEADISRSVAPAEGREFTCLGYPNSKNKLPYKGKKITPNLLTYTSVGRPPSRLPKIATDAHHILVDYNAKSARDAEDKKVSAASIPGCSGGAIIDLGRISAETLNANIQPKLAAVLIEAHRKEGVILGTRLATILAGLRAARSAVSPVRSSKPAASSRRKPLGGL